ncbi:MAG: PAS domain S-box protein [Promethearchaeota archaeon]
MILQIEAPFITLVILRLIWVLPSFSYYKRLGQIRFIYMMVGWFLWGVSPISHLLESYHCIFTFFYGFSALLGTYFIIASIFCEFSIIPSKKINIGAIILIVPFSTSYFIIPESYFFLLTLFQAVLILGGLLLGIVFNNGIRKTGGKLSFVWFILLGLLSVVQIMMFILISDFSTSYYAFGLNYLIIFLINFFIISVEENIMINQIYLNNQEIRKRENRFRSLVESSSDLIWETDEKGKYKFVSKKIFDLLGYKPEELIGKNYTFCMHPEEGNRVKNYLSSIYEAKKPFLLFEYIKIHKDGRKIIFGSSGVPKFDENQNLIGFIGVDRDITELKVIQEKLILGQKMEAIGRFAGGIAHDFNNILTVIVGLSDYLIDEISEKESEKNIPKLEILDEFLTDINKAGKRASELTRQLLAFSRKQILNPKVINVNTIIEDMETMLRKLVSEDISFVINYGGSINNIMCDPNQFEQVIMNLALNARDSMPKGGKLIIETSNSNFTSEISITKMKPGHYVLIAVSDTGIGMDEEQLSHLFEPFYTTKRLGNGTGLGLSTVYGIVKQSKGEISVYTNPGVGTSFKVYFPSSDLPLSEIEISKSYSNEELKGNETILLVEDEDLLRKFVYKILKSHGYNVLTADNPGSALEIYRKYPSKIHLLLTDVIMPQMTGKDLSDIILKESPDIRLLFTSGYADKAIVERGILIEGLNFLQKPFSSKNLLIKIRKILKFNQVN